MMTHSFVRLPLAMAVAGVLMTQAQAVEQIPTTDFGTMVVTASGTAVDVADAPASITVVTREELERRPAASLAEVLQTVSGATGGFTDVGGAKMSFRGMPDAYTLILVDGKRVGDSSLLGHRPDTLTQDLNWITPEIIERIEVVRGPMSVLYGSEAMGGVINIITRKIPQQWHGSVSNSLKVPDGSDRGNTLQMNGTVAGALSETVGVRLGVGYTDKEADKTDRASGTSGLKSKTADLKLTWDMTDEHELSLNAGFGEERSSAYEVETTNALSYDQHGSNKMTRQSYGVGYVGYFGDTKVMADVYHNRMDNEGWVNSATGVPFDNWAKETVFDLKSNFAKTWFGKDNEMTLGLQYRDEQVRNESNIGNSIYSPSGQVDNPNKEPKNYAWAVFGEDQIHLSDTLIATVGARLNHDEKYGSDVSPRGYLVYHPTKAWTVKGGVSRGYKAPTLKQRSGESATSSMGMGCTSLIPLGYSGGGCYMFGNPDLEPESSINYELSVGYDNGRHSADVTYFYNDISDLIANTYFGQVSTNFGNNTWSTMLRNVGDAVTSGVEANYKLGISPNLSLKGSATYMIESENKTTGTPLDEVPEFTTSATLDYQVNDKLSVFTTARYIGEQTMDLVSTSDERLYVSDYTTVDVGANVRFNDALEMKLGVYNVAGESIELESEHDYGVGNPRAYYLGFTTRF